MELDLSELDGMILDKNIGIDMGRSPFLLSSEKFIDLLNSGRAKKVSLNNLVHEESENYFHTSQYRCVSFLSYGPSKIYDL